MIKVVEISNEEEDICSVPLADPKTLSEHTLRKKAASHSTAIFATVLLDQRPGKSQVDCGDSFNLIPATLISINIRLEK